uniref:Uncharacterized protein n=1 Tax=Ditylenchus dipsaci TaxID=166011 RepID=A0A915CNS3_9BILA
MQMSLEGDIYPQRKAMAPEPRPRADNRGVEFYGQGRGGDNTYEDGPNYDGPPPPRRMKFPPPGHQIGGNNYQESYDGDNMTRGPRFPAYRNTAPTNNFQYPRPRFGGGPNFEKPHNYNHEMEMEQGSPFGHHNPNMRGRSRMLMNHHPDGMGHPRHPGWNNNDNFQSPPRFGPSQHNQMRGMGGRAPPRGQMNNNFY